MRYNLIFYIIIRRVHRVALLKFLKGNASSLPNTSKEGWIYVTQDTADMYIFKTDSERIHLNANYANALRENNTLNTGLDVGANNKPVYFKDGVPNEIGYSINADVPNDALFSDNKVKQSRTVTTNYRPLLLHYTATGLNTDLGTVTDPGTVTNQVYYNEIVSVQPSTGTIRAVTFQGNATSASKLTNTSIIGNTNQPVYFTASGVPQKISYTINKSVPPDAAFTDTKVTSVSNHYTPTAVNSPWLSVKADATNFATWGGTDLVTGINLQTDEAGHFTNITVDSIRIPEKPTSGETIKITATNTKDQYLYLTGVTSSNSSDSASLYVTAGSTTSLGPRIEPNSKALYGAVWNDYAECRETKEDIKPGRVVCETGKGDLILSTERLQAGANIVSDTFGFIIGETSKAKTPIAVSGRALAYPLENRTSYAAGDAVCAGPNGTVSKMTREEIREYPDRILGTVSEIPDYEVWGENDIIVDGRIWIKVR